MYPVLVQLREGAGQPGPTEAGAARAKPLTQDRPLLPRWPRQAPGLSRVSQSCVQ